MAWQQIVLTIVFGVSILATIGGIGKQRESITPGKAVATTIINCLLLALILTI